MKVLITLCATASRELSLDGLIFDDEYSVFSDEKTGYCCNNACVRQWSHEQQGVGASGYTRTETLILNVKINFAIVPNTISARTQWRLLQGQIVRLT